MSGLAKLDLRVRQKPRLGMRIAIGRAAVAKGIVTRGSFDHHIAASKCSHGPVVRPSRHSDVSQEYAEIQRNRSLRSNARDLLQSVCHKRMSVPKDPEARIAFSRSGSYRYMPVKPLDPSPS